MKYIKACDICNNAKIDDYLTNNTDYAARSIGKSIEGIRLMLCVGYGKPLRIEVEKWDDKTGWYKIGEYQPKYCPNCGREIVEYT